MQDMWRNWAGLMVPVVVATAGVTMLTRTPPPPTLPLQILPPPPCTTPPTWRPTRLAGPTATRLNAGWRWWEAGAMLATVCEPGTLSVTGTGQVFQGAAPLIVVTLDGTEIDRWTFDGVRTFHVPVAHTGEIVLIFANSLFTRQQSRSLTFQTLEYRPQ